MKFLFSRLIFNRFIPVGLACLSAYCVLTAFSNFLGVDSEKITVIHGEQKLFRDKISNFEEGIQAEIELAGALSNKENLTIFGSSELSTLPYTPYFFLPDSLQMPTIGIGHAYQQTFSIFCELLAMEKNLHNSKICIILSPGWFETGGTNVEAFLEFVRPNFLQSIRYNEDIPQFYKNEIGRYVRSQLSIIENPSENLLYFSELDKPTSQLLQKIDLLSSIQRAIKKKNTVSSSNSQHTGLQYAVKIAENKLPSPQKINWEKTSNRVKKEFLSTIKENSIYVYDSYYKQYLVDKKGAHVPGFNYDINLETNQEFKDFKLLVDLLKRYQCDASFVIQPLNPYHFSDLDGYSEVLDSVVTILNTSNFPCLNMFVTKKEEYDPATLTDVMHLGNYGWMKINRFLATTYNQNKNEK